MLTHFYLAIGVLVFSAAPQPTPAKCTMRGEAIVRIIDKIPQSYIRGEYNITQPNIGDTVLVNMPNASQLQWAVIVELYPNVKNGCKNF